MPFDEHESLKPSFASLGANANRNTQDPFDEVQIKYFGWSATFRENSYACQCWPAVSKSSTPSGCKARTKGVFSTKPQSTE